MVSKPRLIAVLTVKDNILVKSYSYNSWLPCGNISSALSNLDRWDADEIVVLDISRQEQININTLELIKKVNLSTPLVWGGGIRSRDDVHRLLDHGCDRFLLETLWRDNPAEVEKICELVGSQAMIASIPVQYSANGSLLYTHSGSVSLECSFDSILKMAFSEYFITSVETEGFYGSFELSFAESVRAMFPARSVIWFGGLDVSTGQRLLKMKETAGIGFGNINHTREIFLPNTRSEINRHEKIVRH